LTVEDEDAASNGSSQRRPRRARPRVRDLAGRRIIAEGLERNLWTDLYFNAMTISWPAFVAALAGAFVALNSVFALVYALGGYALGETPIANAREGSLADFFFFSVETTSTVGYGDMHPQTIYGHVVATAENFVGLLLLAVMTGLVFARFSRPRARIIFAKYPVLTKHNGLMTLIFRMANARSNFISEARAKLWMLSANVTEEGRRLVGFDQMPLTKSENPSFALSWTLFHPIDEHSPLFGMDKETLAASEINFILSIVGFDETSGQTVHSRDVFTAQDVRWDHEYVDFVWVDDQGLRHIDYAKIDATQLAAASTARAEDEPRPLMASATESSRIQPSASSNDGDLPQDRKGQYN
jgi:inward rectifier potassium channel